MASENVNDHIFETYRQLRKGIVLVGICFPVVLAIVGYIYGVTELGNSWSSYYHHTSVTRDLFVGFLCSIGLLLMIYQGYSKQENVALWIGGFCAIMVAFFPMNYYGAEVKGVEDPCNVKETRVQYIENHTHNFLKDEKLSVNENGTSKDVICDTGSHIHLFGKDLTISFHGLFAVIFFFAAAFVAIFTSHRTLHLLKWLDFFKTILIGFYRTMGVFMFLIPILIFTFIESSSAVFWTETIGLVFFLAYWSVKSWELSEISDDDIRNDTEVLDGMGTPLF